STMIVGDQVFTDVLCGNLSKIRVVLLDPISEETQSFLKFKRKIEKLFDLRNKNKMTAKGE
ncbi:MAG: YqeG family HAD IIIA-type phosphatase, partial [Oscillospiraceae bacterium]|nr:YqeG family HAD IIIA-type phosphatase [Oscillospiraceae bacterium]